ncbi:hypothetical protein RISK_001904 [Rhodopirellula islandica]|uniref:Uncharacterized protein n=1 Tax=Rhodopirellula islandica TaxID=595434 RepID=A0A0J1BHT2_RHOIS|nr:hypothetical protein RISK_001904 [Rhodopirellula islandica]
MKKAWSGGFRSRLLIRCVSQMERSADRGSPVAAGDEPDASALRLIQSTGG